MMHCNNGISTAVDSPFPFYQFYKYSLDFQVFGLS